MNPNVEIISKEFIKPSSQTPDHLKTFKLSFFDQFAPPVYVPIIFFYEANESKGLINSNHVQMSQNLKNSLAETLSTFYPIAGRCRGNGSAIDCNDAGVEFTDARVHSLATELTQQLDAEQMKRLIPIDPATARCLGQRTILFVQLNFFQCGGIAIGICISHQIADMASMMRFISAWATTHVGESKISQLGFQHSRYFPAREFSSAQTWETLMPNQNMATKLLVFTEEKLSALRRTVVCSTRSTIMDPTRVELVSAFIWQHMSIFLKNNPNNQSFAVFHLVNLRTRVGQNHQVLENAFGNFVIPAFVLADNENTVEELHNSVMKIRSSIRSIKGDFLVDAESQDRMLSSILNILMNKEIGEWYFFTSWCRFPTYEVDFGWGKPIRVGLPRGGMKNGMVFMDGKNGEDVEVWISNMDPEILEILQTQLELI